jgi:copper oxidase (laccase) domain-containing protein
MRAGGNLGKIGLIAARLMQTRYGAEPARMLAGVGPCICQSCFEVDVDLGTGLRSLPAFPALPREAG